jgi:HSP20 family protein
MHMLMRFDPFRELDRATQQAFGAFERSRVMPMDAFRHGDVFTVRLDLPGVDVSSVDLTVEKNVLAVSAERSWKPAEGDDVVVAERPHGRFTRQLFLGEGLDTSRIEASYQDGVLTLTIPVAEQAKPRRIQVNAAAPSAEQAIPASSHSSN